MKCRFCNHTIEKQFIDLVNSPASNSYLTKEQLDEPETYYPLKVFVCENCFLVQVDEYKTFDSIFDNNYAYFSSYSRSWLNHSENYVNQVVREFSLGKQSQVVEIASNDGYLLQYFLPYHIPVLGIEPTKNTADVAILKGIPCITDFFSEKLANDLTAKGLKADLIIANNVLAHVPNIIDFVKGVKILLKEDGVATFEFPSLVELVNNNQFDTIYHEHFSYLSVYIAKAIFNKYGLEVFNVDHLPTHGGSLRLFVKHAESTAHPVLPAVNAALSDEISKGINKLEFYYGFQNRALKIKIDLLSLLIEKKQQGKSVVAYGAAAKGNTLLNYCGIKNDLIEFVVDANPSKQNKFMPASHIPILSEQALKDRRPDFVLILPWNLKTEIMKQLEYIREWGGQFVIPVPSIEVL